MFYIEIFNNFKLFLSQTETLPEKVAECEKGGYTFSETIKLTKEIISILSFLIVSHYLKLRIPRLHVDFLRILFEKLSIINTVFHRRNPFSYNYQPLVLYNE